jgi:two-component system, NarL family, invasion response regulator UvrY
MIRVLLVDDHTMFREGLKQILSKHSDIVVVAEAGSGEDALALIRTTTCDAVILDISLPGRSGWEILSDLRRECPALPVLILSMHPEDQYAVRMLRAGAAGYVGKDAAADELVVAIRKVAAGGRYISPAVAEQLAFSVGHAQSSLPHETLSNREFQVMCLLAGGKSIKTIAEELFLSEKTITTYRARILEKLQLQNNIELTHYVRDHRLNE